MLVKLGNLWVDPFKVEGIRSQSSFEEGENTFLGSDNSFGVAVFTAAESGIIVATCPSIADANILRDEFASIINNAVGQSYGGEDEENPANP